MLKLGKNSGNGEIAPDIQPSLRVSTNLGLFKGRSPEEVKKIILAKYEHSDILTSDIPDGWSGEIRSNELSIDEIEKVWEY